MTFEDIKNQTTEDIRAQELCESRGGRPGLSVPNTPYGFCGRKATLSSEQQTGRRREDGRKKGREEGRERGRTTQEAPLTYNHQRELEALLDGLAVDLVGQVGEAHVAFQLLARLAAVLALPLPLLLHVQVAHVLLRLQRRALAVMAVAGARVELHCRGLRRAARGAEEGIPLGGVDLQHKGKRTGQ